MRQTLVDTHAHLTDKAFKDDLPEVLKRAREQAVETIITVGCDVASAPAAVHLAEQEQGLFAVVGIHPHDAPQALGEGLHAIRSLLGHPKVVGLGEIGLDYYWNTWPQEIQLRAFRQQVMLAKEAGLPFVVHDREAHGDILQVLQELAPFPAGFVMHCFSGSPELAVQCIRLGGYVSLAGPVTYKNAVKAVNVAQAVPLERLLLETDCPYLTPQPCRGQRNEPGYVRTIAEKIALLRGVSLEAITVATTENASTIFRLGGVKV